MVNDAATSLTIRFSFMSVRTLAKASEGSLYQILII